ncbi:competence pheromone ComX [Lysinibacillus sphaericus]|uniref:competence pheromone ComX n=1 Tax=Lysinibacillus sphaericus TaxID=1421 RepID=UPI001C5E31BA
MIKVIQYLEQKTVLVTLLKDQKASLIGESFVEHQAILDAFSGEIDLESEIWN